MPLGNLVNFSHRILETGNFTLPKFTMNTKKLLPKFFLFISSGKNSKWPP